MSMPNNSLLTLYSDPTCSNSHRVRFLSAEKENLVEVINVFPHDLPQALLDINPYGTLPTLIDRDVILRDAQVMMEYLDERFPSPTLMPVGPVSRAQVRMMLVTLRDEWFPHMVVLNDMNAHEADKGKAKKSIRSNLLQLKTAFEHYKYCMTDQFSMVDISLAPILWRLKHYEIQFDDLGPHFDRYLTKIFTRKAFANSLSLFEENMR